MRHRKTSTAKHRLPAPKDPTPVVERRIEMVDHTGTAHFLTLAAAENGLPQGWYVAICGEDVVPAALIAREARYCRLCAPISTQKPRGSRR
jgi:hypothetical protein